MKKNIKLMKWSFVAMVFFALAYQSYFLLSEKTFWFVDRIKTEGFFEFMSLDIDLPFAICRHWDILIFFFFCFFCLKILLFANKRGSKLKEEFSESINLALLIGLIFMPVGILAGFFFQAANVSLIMLVGMLIFSAVILLFRKKSPKIISVFLFSAFFSIIMIPFVAVSFELGFVLAPIATLPIFLIVFFLAILMIALNKVIMLFK
jgi:hypothetical protein